MFFVLTSAAFSFSGNQVVVWFASHIPVAQHFANPHNGAAVRFSMEGSPCGGVRNRIANQTKT